MADEQPQAPAAPAAPQAAPAAAPAQQPAAQSSPEEQVGFHKGALSTLAKERQELGRILQIVEQLMQMHVQALKGLGVDLEAMAGQQAPQAPAAPAAPVSSGKPIDDLLNQ